MLEKLAFTLIWIIIQVVKWGTPKKEFEIYFLCKQANSFFVPLCLLCSLTFLSLQLFVLEMVEIPTWVCFPSKFNSFHLDSVCTLNLKHFALWQQLLMMTVRFKKVSFLFVLPDFRQGFDRRTPSHNHLHVRLLHRRHSRSRHPNCCR
jgi:hypothetical protein